MRYSTVIIIAAVIGYITNKPQVNMYVDATRNDFLTISPHTQAMLSKLDDGELEITLFANVIDMNFAYNFPPSEQNNIITDQLDPYIRFKPDTKVKFVYYYDGDSSSYAVKLHPGKSLKKEIAEAEVKTYGLSLKNVLTPRK